MWCRWTPPLRMGGSRGRGAGERRTVGRQAMAGRVGGRRVSEAGEGREERR